MDIIYLFLLRKMYEEPINAYNTGLFWCHLQTEDFLGSYNNKRSVQVFF